MNEQIKTAKKKYEAAKEEFEALEEAERRRVYQARKDLEEKAEAECKSDLQMFRDDLNSAWGSAYGDLPPIKWERVHTKGAIVASSLFFFWAAFIGY